MHKLMSLLLTLLMTCSTAALAEQDRTTGERIDDATLTARVKAALISDEAVKARQIDVETRDGVVQLSGFVDTQAAQDAAVTVARSVPGVAEVRNDLIVRDTTRTVGRAVDDTVIAAKVKTQIAGDANLAAGSEVNVEVNGGVVQLSGFVASEAEKSRAGDIASRVAGVKDVRNNIALER